MTDNKAQELIGKPAPLFSAPSSGGKNISIADYKGKKVVLYFYPKDMTPGCTTQACDFTELHPDFSDLNCVVLGVSKDSPERHDKFIAKHNMPFDLISDNEESEICKDYNVWQLKKFMGKEFMGIVRSTFIIDENGIIVDVISPVKVKEHAKIILEKINNI